MTQPDLPHRLRNVPVREIVRALERDGFVYRRGSGGSRVYRHEDGRRVVVHYHHGGDTLPIGTLESVLAGTKWTEPDAVRLGLV